MADALMLKNVFRIPKSFAIGHHNPRRVINILATATLMLSLLGLPTCAIIFVAILSGKTSSTNDIVALTVEMVLLAAASILAWLGMNTAAQDARRQTARIETILKNISDGVLMLDGQGNYISANPALLRMIPEDKLREINNHPLEETVHWKRTVFSVVAAPILDEGSLIVFRDETRRYETEQARDALLATVSHELRTPLGVVMNYLELLRMSSDSGKVNTAKFNDYLDRALENSHRLLRLINDILDQAQFQAGGVPLKERTFNLRVLLEKTIEAMEMRIKEKGLFYELKIAINVPVEISGDPEHLQKALTNLIGNAVKFTQRGGIRIQVSLADAETLSIAVADSGPGIPTEQLPDIFEAFRRASNYAQREQRGAGLGLSIAKQIVTGMGGEISVSSTLGVGSTFTISLPLAKPK